MPKPLTSDLIRDLASAGSDKTRSRLLREERTLRSPQAVLALCDQATCWALEEPGLAVGAAEAAIWLARTLSDLPAEGLAHRTFANILAARAKPTQALSEYEAALQIFLALEDSRQAAITRSSALPIVTDTLGVDSAFEWAGKARKTFENENDQLRLARLENNLAVLFFRQEDFTRALRHWTAANNTLQKIGETSDQAATLRNLAVCSISLNQPTEARDYYKQARELCVRHGYTFRIHAIDYNIAYLHYLEGDHHRALQLYQAARARSRDLGDIYHESLCSLDETEVYLELNLLEEADTVAQLAATQFKQQQRPYEAAKALFHLALVRSRRGDPREALSLLGSASEAFSGQGNILWPGQIELLRTSVFTSEGRFFEARRSARLALNRFQESRLPRKAALARLFLAKIDLAQGAFIEAEEHCRTSLQTFLAFREPDSLFQTYFLLGRILDTQSDPTGAFEAFSTAEQYLLELRQRLTVSQMLVSTVAQPLQLYAHLVGLFHSSDQVSDQTSEIFRLVQTAKARSFADLMVLSGVPPRAQTPMRSQLVDQVSTLRRELNWLYRRIDRSELPDGTARPSVVDSLQAQSQEKERELAQTLSSLRIPSKTSEVDPEQIGITDLDTLQSLLGETVLAEFFLAHDIVMALVVTARDRKIVPVAVLSTVQDLQRRLWHYLHYSPQRKSPLQGGFDPLKMILRKLYGELLLPVEELLGDSPLLVAPHGFLFLLPFHALVKNERHLIEHAPVSYLPSAATLVKVVSKQPLKVGGFASIGSSTDEDSIDVFSCLREDARAIVSRPGQVLTDSDQGTSSKRRTATHLVARARLRQDNPLFSGVAVGREELTILDLYRSRILSPMITIEGQGFTPDVPSGDRQVSALWRALLASGARCAAIPASYSQPSVHREYARRLYTELFQGGEVAAAHRTVTLTMMQDGAAIQDWAGLFLIGDPFLRFDLKDRR